jgi:Mn2+/Fe2+ NRAMP family transporter
MNDKLFRDREILSNAQTRGPISTMFAFLRLSGPGWLQGAITLGGGSLGGALYLGVIGGNNMLWLQLVAILIGVIMLSAISYVTLSTGIRPYQAINEYVNPVLGVSWITATILANMIFILPQFALCYDVLDTNFGVVESLQSQFADETAPVEKIAAAKEQARIVISGVLAFAAFVIVIMSYKPGLMSRLFDLLLKLIVAGVVVSFVAAVVYLTQMNEVDWNSVLLGFIPDFMQWNNPSPTLATMVDGLDGKYNAFWSNEIIQRQRSIMIGTAATAVGINMTFLLPYSMLARGWDKPFRGLAIWDLVTGLAIPFIVVTSCIVLCSAFAFHGKVDADFESNDPAVFQQSRIFNGTKSNLKARILADDESAFDGLDQDAELALIAEQGSKLSIEEKTLAAALVKPNTKQLAQTLEPLLGEKANLVFGIGAVGMGFSTIIILMLINGYAFAEVMGQYHSNLFRAIGALLAGIMGFCWFLIWTGASKTWLIILASSFAAILLPIAYIAFFALMNNRQLLGEEKPTGVRMSVWNVLMAIGVIGAVIQSVGAISTKISDPVTGNMVLGGVATFLLLALVGFSARPRFEEEYEQS